MSEPELLKMLELEKPASGSYEEINKFQLEKLVAIESLKDVLLEECHMCLSNVHGKGYTILHPNDQVIKEPANRLKKMRTQLNKAVAVLINVNQEMLNMESQNSRNYTLGRLAFIKSSLNKRKVIPMTDKKQLEGVG